jgi:hypothetical protein
LLSKATLASQKVLAIERQCKASSRAAWVLKEVSETKIELHFHVIKSKEQARSVEEKWKMLIRFGSICENVFTYAKPTTNNVAISPLLSLAGEIFHPPSASDFPRLQPQ